VDKTFKNIFFMLDQFRLKVSQEVFMVQAEAILSDMSFTIYRFAKVGYIPK